MNFILYSKIRAVFWSAKDHDDMFLLWGSQVIPKYRLMNSCKIHIQKQRHNGAGKITMEIEIRVM